MRSAVMLALADPSATLLLLAAGVLGVCWELAVSGLIAPAVAGSVCIVLALNSSAAATFDRWGVALLASALCFFALEAVLRSRGVLTLAGASSMMAGLLLIDRPMGWVTALGAAIAFSLLLSFLLSVAVAARRSKLAILGKGDTARS